MRLGIFAGGFKPFTAGHFSKLALASQENDWTLLLYGMSARTKGSGLNYTADMAKQVLGIVKPAIERALPNVIVIEAKPSPIAASYSVLGHLFAGRDLNDPDIELILRSIGELPNAVSVYSDREDLARNYLSYVGTPKEKQYWGSARTDGRLFFDDGLCPAGSLERVALALSPHTPGDDIRRLEKLASVRGSEFRALVSAGRYQDAGSMLPPVLLPAERDEIIRIVSGRALPKPLAPTKTESHIMHLHEAHDMPLAELREVFHALLSGGMEGVEEKIDGQNLTFTVRNGRVETYTKGVTWGRLQKRGRCWEDYDIIYADRPSLRDAYKQAHAAAQFAVDANPQLSRRIFREGSSVVEAAMVFPGNPNIVPYEKPGLFLIGCLALDPEGYAVDPVLWENWAKAACNIQHPIPVSMVPNLKMSQIPDRKEMLGRLDAALRSLCASCGLSASCTVGDLLVSLGSTALTGAGMNPSTAQRVASRLMLSDKSAFSKEDAKFSPGLWERVQRLEASTFAEEALIPFERILCSLAMHLFEYTPFVLAPENLGAARNMQQFVLEVSEAMKRGGVSASTGQLDDIRVCIERIGDPARWNRATEGIVFPWRGRRFKLTGLFTPINKLHGAFTYGSNPARIIG